jgi:hypothetical protein
LAPGFCDLKLGSSFEILHPGEKPKKLCSKQRKKFNAIVTYHNNNCKFHYIIVVILHKFNTLVIKLFPDHALDQGNVLKIRNCVKWPSCIQKSKVHCIKICMNRSIMELRY